MTNQATPSMGALEVLSPFQLKDQLIAYAKDATQAKSATHKFLNAGRGNPNWVATTPREAYLVVGAFALEESKRVWEEPGFGGMPGKEGIAARFASHLGKQPDSPGVRLLRRAVSYGVEALGFDADAFIHEMVDSWIGDNYPEPDRMLRHAEAVVGRFLAKEMCDGRPPPGRFDLFAVEGGTAAMCYVFHSLVENRILRRVSPITTPRVRVTSRCDHVEARPPSPRGCDQDRGVAITGGRVARRRRGAIVGRRSVAINARLAPFPSCERSRAPAGAPRLRAGGSSRRR